MLQLSSPNRQQAHELIERITAGQLAVVTCLLKTMIASNQPGVVPAAFSDEPVSRRGVAGPLPCMPAADTSEAVLSLVDDSDFWPARRRPVERISA